MLDTATSDKPTFTADLAGTYVATLTVNDGKVSSVAGTTTVEAAVANTAPVANAGVAQNVLTGDTVTLDGSTSSDANGDPLIYNWSLTSKPMGSIAALASATSAKPTFTADLAGTYVATLTVNDGKVSSAAVSMLALASSAQTKPPLPQGQYEIVSQALVVLVQCAVHGHMSNDAAARGIRLLSEDLSRWDYSEEHLKQTANRVGIDQRNPTASECTDIASIPVEQVEGQAAPSALTNTPVRPQENAWAKFLREDQERTAREQVERQTSTGVQPQEDAWSKFLREDQERTSRERVKRQAELASRIATPNSTGGWPVVAPISPGQAPTPSAVYPASSCIGAIVQGNCVGTVQSTEPQRRCMGAMVNGTCTGPVIISR
jgi:hypothetical protein